MADRLKLAGEACFCLAVASSDLSGRGGCIHWLMRTRLLGDQSRPSCLYESIESTFPTSTGRSTGHRRKGSSRRCGGQSEDVFTSSISGLTTRSRMHCGAATPFVCSVAGQAWDRKAARGVHARSGNLLLTLAPGRRIQ